MGYHRAGFDEIVGVDSSPQPRYPFRFVQDDALNFQIGAWDGWDAIHASPPCQRYSTMRKGLWKDREHIDMVEPIRKKLIASGLPYVIENVPGAPLIRPVTLCGTMFRLGTKNAELRRHRLFEIAGFSIGLIPACAHGSYGYKVPVTAKDGTARYWPSTIEVYGNGGGSSKRDSRQMYPHRDHSTAMGIDWMNGDELSQAIPPAYTEFIGRQLLTNVRQARRTA